MSRLLFVLPSEGAPFAHVSRTAQRTFCTEGDLRIISYERVSTARQRASGLGSEAQRQAIEGNAQQRGATLIARFTEVESGRCPDRPELGKALHLPSHRRDAGDRQARPAVTQRRLPVSLARLRDAFWVRGFMLR